MVVQFTVTSGRAARGPRACRARATRSFPVPVSPVDFDYTQCHSLGLQLVVDLTHQLQGVFVVSHPAKGAAFTVTFTPMTPAASAAKENAS